ncbi:hypothetical protein VTJ49DRAFT_3587 [Mycothermus thermophilus]|uniref:thymidylate synthase n=1 Tax=Humicola insolens TaxID=85995 RepID=A0ABR3VME0_HUMIN
MPGMPEGPIKAIPGARPIRPGDLDGLWAQEKRNEIVKRVKYLVNDDLEEPPHILAARRALYARGKNWRDASDDEILRMLDSLPRALFESKIWKRHPPPPANSDYYDLVTRIHSSELDFYGYDSNSPGGRLLYMLRDARLDPCPSSFYQHLKRAGISVDRAVHFTRRTVTRADTPLLSLPYKLEDKRRLFVGDMARFLAQMQGRGGGEIPNATFVVPPGKGRENRNGNGSDDAWIEEGFLKIDSRTLLFDTTMNSSLLQAVREAGLRPAVIIKQFTFWPDGADEDTAALEKAAVAEYNTTHWLTQNYDVYERHPGSGFVSCNPTIYIRKGRSLNDAPVEAPTTAPTPTIPPTLPVPRHEEYQYLELVREILDHGELRRDRTGTGTYSLFAPTPLKFSLNRSGTPILPLLTTKRVYTRAIIAELLWFISGDTSSQTLSSQNVKIWDGNGSRAFLDSLGFTDRQEGDLGPVYGFQWRHFGAQYVDCKTDYTGQGVDQLARIIRTLRTNPYDRRLVLSAWNPADMSKMVLPPCHMFAQFYVSFPGSRRGTQQQQKQSQGGEEETKVKGHLHCQLYQRSCDMGLGVPFNIASYALLTHMLARVTGLVPGSLTHVMGDAHVYLNHVEALETQLTREPREFPELEIVGHEEWDETKGDELGIDGWKVEDFVIRGYEPHKAIQMEMSV